MKKIAFINIFHGVGGGGEVYLSRLINKLCPSIVSESFLISPSCKVLNSVPIKREFITGVSMELTTNTVFEMLKTVIEINRILKRNKPDIIIINGDRAILLSPFLFTASRKIGVKHMLIASKFKFLLNLFSFKSLDKIVTISNFHVENYTSFGFGSSFSNKLTMIYNSVAVDYFKVDKIKKDNDIVTFIEIASLEKRKGQLDMLTVFANLRSRYKNIILKFVGAGSADYEYRKFVEEHGLSTSVFFLGFQSDVRSFLSEDKCVFVLPSYDEGLPIVLLEAMSCCLPVISTSIAGIPEIIDQEKNGFIFTPGDTAQLEKYMEYFIQNPKRIDEIGAEGRRKVLDTFNEKDWVEKWQLIL